MDGDKNNYRAPKLVDTHNFANPHLARRVALTRLVGAYAEKGD
jgi:hypothetical protein